MQRFWMIIGLVLWFGFGCSRDVPVEGFPFFDQDSKRITLWVSSPEIKDGSFLLKQGQIREVKFSPPLQLGARTNRVRLKIAYYRGPIWIEFFGGKMKYAKELPALLSGGGYFTVELPPSRYEGFRLWSEKGKEPLAVAFQEGRVGDFPLHTRFEGGRFLEIASSFMPVRMEKTQVVFKLQAENDPSPLRGVRLQLMNKEPVPSAPIRVTFFGSGKERRTLSLRTRPILEDLVVYRGWLGFSPIQVQMEGLDGQIVLTASLFSPPKESVDAERAKHDASSPMFPPAVSLPPLPADLETVLSFPQDAWRTKEVEVFRWSLFPEILIFDTKDYNTQKELFHRLAFYLEKKGYRGKLHPEEKIWELHGWNAHNYRGEGLASFFNEAVKTNFPLNSRERWLAEYLVTYGVLERRSGTYVPGKGGLLSISRESTNTHRRFLLSHEAFHGVYYVSKPFQEAVASLWKGLSVEERKYWLYVLSWLQYDTSDPYLVVNEFQAYLLQQSPNQVDRYFKETMVKRILEKNPEMEGFFKELFEKHPDMFLNPALRLQGFLEKELGISSSTFTTISLN